MEADQYERQSECEDYADYGAEGYHPVEIGEKFNGIYTVVQKLGWGHFSTVWLAQQENSKEYYALKIQRSKESHTESAIDQLEMLTQIRKHQSDPQWIEFLSSFEKEHPTLINSKLCRPLLLYDNFPHFGIHGKHMCSVFELMGPNLLDVIQHYEFKDKRMPLWLVKKITRDVLIGLVYLHERCSVIHTDLKPQNIMIKMEPYEQQLLIEQLKNYKIKPVSMKYLKNLYASKNPKNKKKLEKKKKKKKLQSAQNQNKEDDNDEEQSSELSQSISKKQQPPSPLPQEQGQSLQFVEKDLEPEKQQPKIEQKEQNSMPIESSSNNQVSATPQSSYNAESSEISHSSPIQNKFSDIQDGVDMSILLWKSVKIQLNDKLFFKIVDMGNACFTHKHYTEDIQTRQYRSPEVLIGYDYHCNTDIFSLACTVFEMMTNNFLFKPKKISGIKKNQEHLYQMIETLGPMDKQFALGGKFSNQMFNKKGKLLNGNPKQTNPISKLLVQKYGYEPGVAVAAEQFLLPMLAYEPKNRIDSRNCLKSKWLWD